MGEVSCLDDETTCAAMSVEDAAIVEDMARRGGACFVSELSSSLSTGKEAVERALGRLVTDGRVVMRHNFCADPHFVNEDLRAVALVDLTADDPQSAGDAACDRLWQRWMSDFLASHRCT